MRYVAALSFAFFVLARPAFAYIDVSPTLGYLIKDAKVISVLEVDKISQEKRAILFKKVEDLKGTLPDAVVRHHIADGYHPREPRTIMDWAEPGKVAIAFTSDKSSIICLGRYWYEVAATQDGWWSMTTGRPELGMSYYGRVEKLRDSINEILGGKTVVVTAINHGTESGVFQYSTVAFQKILRGKDSPVWRIKANLDMPDSVWKVTAKGSPWIVGPGFAGGDDVPGLIKTMLDKTNEAKMRSRAASDLGLAGWLAKSALPALAEVCRDDPEPLVKVRAARAYALISHEPELPVKVLCEALTDKSVAIRKAAAISLGDLGVDAKGAVECLRESVADSDPGVRWASAEALGRIGPAAAPAVAALALALRDKELRVIAADSLGGIGPASRGAVPLLIDALKDSDAEYRWTAAVALTRIDSKSAKVGLPLFIEKISTGDLRARWDAMQYIAPMGLDAKAAADALRPHAKHNGVAGSTLATIAGPDAVEAIPVLLHVLDDDWDTTDDLARIGPATIPGLIAIMQDPKSKVHHLAAKALGLLVPKSDKALLPLLAALKSPDKNDRKAAATALGNVTTRPKEAIAPLIELLKDKEGSVRNAAAGALRNVQGPVTEPVVPVLIELVMHGTPNQRRKAAQTLARYGAAAESALPTLRKAQEDPDPGTRAAVAWAYAKIAGAEAAHSAIPVLLGALKASDPKIRQEAARLLGTLGPDARDAHAALVEARRNDASEEVRRVAAESASKLQVR
jgi:HEAT repeat protein